MSAKPKASILEGMVSGCLMNRARLVSRILTGIYEDELRPLGLKGSQLTLLAAVAYMGAVRRSDLGKTLHLDASTLTRNLRVMETNGWIVESDDASDGRGAPVKISAAGEAILAKASPAWQAAQLRATRLLGRDGRDSLVAVSNGIWTA